MRRTPVNYRLPDDLIQMIEESAKRNFRKNTAEVEFRLRESFMKNPSGATNTLGSDQISEPETDHEHSNPEPKP